MRITVARRLAVLAAVGTLALVAVGVIGQVAATTQGERSAEMASTSDAMSRQWNADMLHDGIRADVMAALYATSDRQRAAYGVVDVRAKAQSIVANFDGAGRGAPADLRPRFRERRADLVSYASGAVQLVDLAGRDPVAARAALPAFLDQFERLESELGSIDAAMLAAVDASKRSASASAASTRRLDLLAALVALFGFAVAITWVGRSLLRPVRRMLAALEAVAERDLTVRVERTSGDELGQMADALNTALTEIGATIGAAGQATGSLATASQELTGVAEALGRSAGQTAGKAGAMAASAQQVSSSVDAVSSAAVQMGASIQEISGQTTAAVGVAAEAVAAVEETGRSMAELDVASEAIGQIVKAITSIAAQTNLLALNATIEAARAGDSGKGFAVVANEVKELARETAEATDDIAARIAGIQSVTVKATSAMHGISSVIDRISQNQSIIAAAIEEQSLTTESISRSVGDISQGASHIAENVTEIATSTGDTAQNADTTRVSARDLSTLATDVDALIGRFRY